MDLVKILFYRLKAYIMSTPTTIKVPKAFIRRRIHSLMGLWIVIYLIEHLVTNSQAALWIGNDGREFIKIVNFIHSLPFLKVLEVMLLGVPILYHAIWGIKYALTSKNNTKTGDGSKPALNKYARNWAYFFQRASSWILLIGIIAHVVQMRFIDYPHKVQQGSKIYHLVKITSDKGLVTLSNRLGFSIYTAKKIADLKETNLALALKKFSMKDGQVIASADNPGTAFLLNVRDTFKSPLMIFLYSIFVIAAVYHGFNGLWTFLITWGVILSMRSQKKMVNVCYGAMIVLLFLGLFSIFGTYWINLRY